MVRVMIKTPRPENQWGGEIKGSKWLSFMSCCRIKGVLKKSLKVLNIISRTRILEL